MQIYLEYVQIEENIPLLMEEKKEILKMTDALRLRYQILEEPMPSSVLAKLETMLAVVNFQIEWLEQVMDTFRRIHIEPVRLS